MISLQVRLSHFFKMLFPLKLLRCYFVCKLYLGWVGDEVGIVKALEAFFIYSSFPFEKG